MLKVNYLIIDMTKRTNITNIDNYCSLAPSLCIPESTGDESKHVQLVVHLFGYRRDKVSDMILG